MKFHSLGLNKYFAGIKFCDCPTENFSTAFVVILRIISLKNDTFYLLMGEGFMGGV